MKLLHRNSPTVKVVLSDSAYITGLSEKDLSRIENELTFNNPKYAQVKKYSKWSTTKVPQYLEYFEHIEFKKEDIFKIPLGYFFSKNPVPNAVVKDCREYTETEFPKFKLELRETQQEALDEYIRCNKDSFKSSVQLPTGKGKTILGIALAEKLKAKTLIVVHKVDLIDGWIKDIKKSFDDKADIGIIRAKKKSVGEHFTIATIQTLNNLKPRELEALYYTFGFVILDECHHVPSTTFSLVNNFKSRYRLGLSATHERNDGLTHIIKLYFGDFCYNYSERQEEAEEVEKDILPFKVYRRDLPVYYDPICIRKNKSYSIYNYDRNDNFNPDYKLQEGEKRLSKIGYNDRPNVSYACIDKAVLYHEHTSSFILNDILSEYKKGHSCLVLFKQVNTLLEYYRLLMMNRNVCDEDIGLYYGGNSKCAEVKQKAENQRKYITLATYSKAAEGTNVQQWEVAFLVSSINNGKDLEQSVGRIRRIKEGGKKLDTTLVYDYRYSNVYALNRHGSTRDIRYRSMLGNGTSRNSKFTRGF